MSYHDNIHIDAADDDCRVVIAFDAEHEVRIDTPTIFELVEKLCVHRKHPAVRALMDRISKLTEQRR